MVQMATYRGTLRGRKAGAFNYLLQFATKMVRYLVCLSKQMNAGQQEQDEAGNKQLAKINAMRR